MQQRPYFVRTALGLVCLITVLLFVAACGPRPVATPATAEEPTQFLIDLPSLVVDIHSDGQPTIGNVSIEWVDSIAGTELSALAVPKEWVDWFVASNIQHVQVASRPDGVMILVNGEPIPSLAWDGEALEATAETLRTFGVVIPLAEKVLPLASRIGVGIIMRFPVPAGAELIPFYVEGDATAAAAARTAQERFLEAVGAPPVVSIPVTYQADGSWEIGGMSDEEWVALTGLPVNALRLDQNLIASMTAANVQHIRFSTNPGGVFIAINSRQLPHLTWGKGEVHHLLNLTRQTGLLNMLAMGADVDDIVTTIETFLPIVQTVDASLIVFFPVQAGAPGYRAVVIGSMLFKDALGGPSTRPPRALSTYYVTLISFTT